MTALRAAFSYIRTRSAADMALATFATAIAVWLSSRLVLASGARNSLPGVALATVFALILLLAWCAIIWIWFTRNRGV